MVSNQQSGTATNKTKKVTLGQVYQQKGLELLTYIDKKKLVDNEVVFCVVKAELIDVPNSKFDISQQWVLTIVAPTSDDTTRKFWLTFLPNEVRDDFMKGIQEGLQEAHKQNMVAVHSCKLQAIPNNKYENGVFYALNFTSQDCECGLDA